MHVGLSPTGGAPQNTGHRPRGSALQKLSHLGGLAFVLPIFLFLAQPTPTLAQEGHSGTAEDIPPEAVEAFRLARERYAAGQYRGAADQLERALHYDPESPTLVYNLARVYELLGELDRAVETYQLYQRLLPQQQAREAEQAAATLRRLEGARASGALDSPVPTQQVEALRQLPGLVLVREAGVADSAFWITFTAGVAFLATGAVFAPLALDARTQAEAFVLGRNGDSDDRLGAFEDASNLALIGDIGIGAGAVATLSALLLYFLREQTVERAPIEAVEPGPSVTLTASASQHGGMIGLGGMF